MRLFVNGSASFIANQHTQDFYSYNILPLPSWRDFLSTFESHLFPDISLVASTSTLLLAHSKTKQIKEISTKALPFKSSQENLYLVSFWMLLDITLLMPWMRTIIPPTQYNRHEFWAKFTKSWMKWMWTECWTTFTFLSVNDELSGVFFALNSVQIPFTGKL